MLRKRKVIFVMGVIGIVGLFRIMPVGALPDPKTTLATA